MGMTAADLLWFAAIGAIAWGIICTYAAIYYARKARRLEERVSSKLWRELGWAHAIASDSEITTEEMERALSTIIGDESPLPGEITREVIGSWEPHPPAPSITMFPISLTAQEIARAQVVHGEPPEEEYRGVVAGDIASKVKVGDEVWIRGDACRITWVGLPDEEGNVGMHAASLPGLSCTLRLQKTIDVGFLPLEMEAALSVFPTGATAQEIASSLEKQLGRGAQVDPDSIMVNGEYIGETLAAKRPVTWEECATCQHNECSNPNAIIGPSSGRDRCTGYVEVSS
jgi:hypothetical protein